MTNIPAEELASRIRDERIRQEAMDAYLVQQEVLVALTTSLHRAGLIDGDAAAAHVKVLVDDLRAQDLVSDYGCTLAELFQGRVRHAIQDAESPE